MSDNIESQWTNEGFNQRFEEIIKEGKTYPAAYHQVEEEHKVRFGKYRYKSYDSFRSSRLAFITKRDK